MDLAVETHNLVKVFKNNTIALNGIDLHIEKGTIFSFLGPNGAGKTTTVRVLSCILKPTSGNAAVFGTSVRADDVLPIREKIGVLTENHGLYERMTVNENLYFFGSFYGLEKYKLEDNITRLLADFNLTDRRDHKVGTLSKGLKQRAALIKTLVHDPPLVFLDEPTAGLDPKAAAEFRDYIQHLGSQMDKTIFMCTHNLHEAQELSDLVAIIDKGVIKKLGPPSELEKEIFQSTTYTCISTKPIPPGIQSRLKENHGVDAVLNNNEMNLFLKPDREEELVPAIVSDLVGQGVPIMQFVKASHSLEDVYLELMRGDEP